MIKTSKEALDEFVWRAIRLDEARTQGELAFLAAERGHLEPAGEVGTAPTRDIEGALKRLKTRGLVAFVKDAKAWENVGQVAEPTPVVTDFETDSNGAGGLDPIPSILLAHVDSITVSGTMVEAPGIDALLAAHPESEVIDEAANRALEATARALSGKFHGFTSLERNPTAETPVAEVWGHTFDEVVERVRSLGDEQRWLWIAEFPWLVTQADVWEMA